MTLTATAFLRLLREHTTAGNRRLPPCSGVLEKLIVAHLVVYLVFRTPDCFHRLQAKVCASSSELWAPEGWREPGTVDPQVAPQSLGRLALKICTPLCLPAPIYNPMLVVLQGPLPVWVFLAVYVFFELAWAEGFLDALTGLRKATVSFVMSVRPPVHTHGISLFPFEHLEKFASLKFDKNNGYFTRRRFHIDDNVSLILLKLRNIWNKSCREDQNAHNVLSKLFFFSRKSCRLWGDVKKLVQPETP